MLSSSVASESGAATFVVTTKHRRFALLKRSYKANQPERNSRLLVVRLILTLVRFASLSVRTDLWGPLVASLLVENTQRTLLDIKLTSKWFGLPRTTLHDISIISTKGIGIQYYFFANHYAVLELNTVTVKGCI